MVPKVSVIVPIYKAEKYIERCVMSLLKQTLEEIELIFVDDCSPDRSIDILKRTIEQYPNKLNHIKLVHHNTNLGVSISRQDGVNAAIGDYIIHCDPDDWVEPEMYNNVYNYAIQNHADIVICDYVMEYHDKSVLKKINLKDTNSTNLMSALVEGKLHGGLWNKLVKRKFITNNNIFFTPGLNICEDLIYCLRLMQKRPSVSYLNIPLYHYDKYSNPNAMTHPYTQHRRIQHDILYNTFNDLFYKHKKDKIYRTGITYIAYWAFAHDVLSNIEFRNQYTNHLMDIIKSNRQWLNKFPLILSIIGLKKPLFYLYRHLKFKDENK